MSGTYSTFAPITSGKFLQSAPHGAIHTRSKFSYRRVPRSDSLVVVVATDRA